MYDLTMKICNFIFVGKQVFIVIFVNDMLNVIILLLWVKQMIDYNSMYVKGMRHNDFIISTAHDDEL